MTKKELEKLEIETEHGTFTPLYVYDEAIPIFEKKENEDEENEEAVIDFEIKGLKILKSAQEVYEEWLEERNKPMEAKATKDIQIAELERKINELNMELQNLIKTYETEE